MRDLIRRILLEQIKWDYNAIKDEALKYKTRVEFSKNSKSAYNAAKRMGIFDEITSHMPIPKEWTIDELESEAQKYRTITDFQKNSKGAYLKAYRLGILKDITKHMTTNKAETLNTDKFIDKAKKIHGDKYDYSLVDYRNSKTPVTIICHKHGNEFQQEAGSHLAGRGCPICANEIIGLKRRTPLFDFIDKANQTHNHRYSYNKSEYKNSGTKLIVTCPKHGDFLVTPANHVHNGSGCPICFGTKKLTTQEFIDKAKKIHGDRYDYSLSNYLSSEKPIEIICKLHGPFLQMAYNHLKGDNCPKCAGNQQSDTEEFIKKAKLVHGNRFNYDKVDYVKNKIPVVITCPKENHGDFIMKPNSHLGGSGCPICSESRGEKFLSLLFNYLQIQFTRQKKFVDCVNLSKGKKCRQLPFDFYLPEYNTVVEYDGIQHFKEVGFWGGTKSLETQKVRDEIKNKYCLDNGIKIIRIPYTMDKTEIEPFIKKELGITS